MKFDEGASLSDQRVNQAEGLWQNCHSTTGTCFTLVQLRQQLLQVVLEPFHNAGGAVRSDQTGSGPRVMGSQTAQARSLDGLNSTGRKGRMLVYEAADVVSGYLTSKPRWYWPFASWGWEQYEIKQTLWVLRQYKPPPRQQQQGPHSHAAAGPLVVDVGAIVGAFKFHAAAAGARVAAFEAMPQNVELLRHSICLNPWLQHRILIFGLGPGLMDLRRLDTLITEDVQVLKNDVEGFELQVLQGAESLLAKHRVQYILAECNTAIGGADNQIQYLQWFDSHGYRVSGRGFKGPFLSQQDIPAGTAKVDALNLYAVRQA